MSTVQELLPGDKVVLLDQTAVFIAQTQHPIYSHLQLVIWRMSDWSWSHDALDARQHVGDVEPTDPATRAERLREWLLGGPR